MLWWILGIIAWAITLVVAWCFGFVAGSAHMGRRSVNILRAEGWSKDQVRRGLFPTQPKGA